MLQALLQTIANLGFSSGSVNETFNAVLAAVQAGDTGTLGSLLKGVVSAVTGVDSADVGLVASSILMSVMEMLSSAGTSGVLTTITGA